MKKRTTSIGSVWIALLLFGAALGGDGPPAAPGSPAATKKVITVALVRHAEKKNDKDDPALTREGRKRAENLAHTLRRAKIDALFASDLKRTMETVEPLAQQKGLKITSIKEVKDLIQALKGLPQGSFAVVSHHSYTLKEILEGLGVPKKEAEELDVDVYDNLFLILYHPDLETKVLNLTY
jgi:phosphohistidine phosphatase SixA